MVALASVKCIHARNIGLLGGSFNPAHAGHRHISLEAMKRLGLDQVWWLVSPANPLKDPATLAIYSERLESARALAQHPRIQVSDIEQRLGTRYTVDTVAALQQRFPATRFVWLMGADNLQQFHRWRRWEEIATRIPIAVFDRAPYQHHALASRFAVRFAKARIPESNLRNLAAKTSPAWGYCFIPPHHASATEIRKTLGK